MFESPRSLSFYSENVKSNINTENGDARICLNERLFFAIAANFLEILAPVHAWRFNVSCFEVLDGNKVRF